MKTGGYAKIAVVKERAQKKIYIYEKFQNEKIIESWKNIVGRFM